MIDAGLRLGRYEIVAPIGAGGMGEVFRAYDTNLQRPIALKVLSLEAAGDAQRVRRFQQEARAASALNHPNILHVYEVGEATVGQQRLHFIAMELVDGATLRSHFTNQTGERRLLQFLAQVADALAKAHASGILHRDLKPENVVVTNDGFAKVLDFGLAKLLEPSPPALDHDTPTAVLTRAGAIVGTPAYMSPEQVEGRELDQRSDIFSLGSILYEAVAHRRAFDGSSVVDVMHKIVHDEPRPLAERQLNAIVTRCLRKDPAKRYGSAAELAHDLRGYLTAAAAPVSPRSRKLWFALALVGVLLVAITVAIRQDARRAAPVKVSSAVTAAQQHAVAPPPKPTQPSWSNFTQAERSANLKLLARPTFLDGRRVYRGEVIKFNLRNADLRDFANVLSSATGVDIALAPGAVGSVSIHAENTPWDEVFEIVLKQNGLKYRVQNGLVVVEPAKPSS